MILDITVIAVIVIMCIIGAKRGILKSALRICSWLLSTVMAWFFFSPVADFLKSTPLADIIRETVKTSYVEPRLSDAEQSIPELFGGIFEAANGAADTIAAGISDIVIAVLAFVLTLILCRLLILLIGLLFGAAAKLPVVKQCNKLLGGALGAAEGVLILYIAAALMFAFAPLRGNVFFEKQLDDSRIASQIYENNFITDFTNKTNLKF